MRKLRCVLL